MATHSYFDSFFFGVLMLVALLTFTDFLLGKNGREKVKQLVGEWWVYLDDSTYAGLGADDAARLLHWVRKGLGPIRSLRFWISTFAGACVLLVITIHVVSSLMFGEPIISGALEASVVVPNMLVDRGALLFLSNTLMPVISLVATLGFLRLMSSTKSLIFLFLLILANAIAALTILVATVVLVQNHRTWDAFDFGNVLDQLIWMSGGTLTLLPVLLYIVLATLFMISKLTMPILKKPVNLIVLRLHQSDKGVLSLAGVALGAMAKLTQEGLKLI